jgi:hypothetical protein
MLLHAELEAVICSGAGRSYALFDERVPPGRPRPRDEALAELAARYVAGHGPATLADFVWWSGLTVADARAALASFVPPPDEPGVHRPRRAFLLPNYDEYIVGYADRAALLDPGASALERNVLFHHTVVVDGRVAGTWRRTIGPRRVALDAIGFAPFTATQRRLIEEAAGRYGQFLGRPVEVAFRC